MRHHAAGAVADLQLLDVLDLVAELGVGLDDHLPGAAEEVEVVDVQRAQVDLQGVVGVAPAARPASCTGLRFMST